MLTVRFTAGEQMKEQYLGDVSDYRKYALIRLLTTGSGLRLGVCWMLTSDDGRNDGNKLGYLADRDKWRAFDPPVFDLLKRVVAQPESRRLDAIEHSGVLGQAVFFDRHLPDNGIARCEYMVEAKRRLAGCDLVFFDPDNGLEVPSVPKGRKNSSKYLYLDEAAEFWEGGASVLIYQHFTREHRQGFKAGVVARLSEALPGSQIVLFATAHVLFILAAQPRHVTHFAKAADRIARIWPTWFVELRPTPPPAHSERPQSAVTTVTAYTRKSAHVDVCEARMPGGPWVRIGIAEAIERRGAIEMRCPDCHGRVRAHRAASDGRFRAHFEHTRRHDGCSSSPRFNGASSRHPAAVE